MSSGLHRKLAFFAALLSLANVGDAKAVTPAGDTLYKQVAPAVVFIYGTDDQAAVSGTGSIIREDGYILTNAQILRSPLTRKFHDKIFVFLKPDQVTGNLDQDLQRQRAYPARVVTANSELDLGLVKLISLDRQISGLPRLDLGNGDGLATGTEIYAFGHPGEGQLWSQTPGKIGGYAENYTNVRGWGVYQHSVPLRRGHSGGPLLANDGTQIGINIFVASENGELDVAPIGTNFAVSSATARRWIVSAMGEDFLPGSSGRIAAPLLDYRPPGTVQTSSEPTVRPAREPAGQKPREPAGQIAREPAARQKPGPPQQETAFNLPRSHTVDFDSYLARLKKSALETLRPDAGPTVSVTGTLGQGAGDAPTEFDKRFSDFLKNLKASQ